MKNKIYHGPNDPALPNEIQILNEEARQVYVIVWNETLGLCMGQGGNEQECSLRATKAATIAVEPTHNIDNVSKYFKP